MNGFQRALCLRTCACVAAAALIASGGTNEGESVGEASLGTSVVAREALPVLAPDFALPSLDGRTVRLADLRGKIVVLNFWATWCAPCKVEMPWLIDLYGRFRAEGLEVVGVSMDDRGRDAIETFTTERHVNYPIVLGSTTVADAYGGVRFLPQSVFIGRDGRIIKHTYGIRQKADFENDIKQSLTP